MELFLHGIIVPEAGWIRAGITVPAVGRTKVGITALEVGLTRAGITVLADGLITDGATVPEAGGFRRRWNRLFHYNSLCGTSGAS